MSPEVAADAAEPPGVVVHAAVFPGATPAAVSPEVAADAAEPTEAAVLPLIPCMVVAPSNALAACHVTIKGTITELTAFVETPDGTAVEPLEVAASTAEPPEVSVVSTYELSPCPVTARKAVCELSPCPVTAKEAVCELSPCPVTAKEAVCELSPCPVTAKKAVCELSPCPVTAKEAVCELSPCPVTAMEAVSEPLLRSGPADRAVPELSSCLVTATEAGYEPLNPPIMSPEFIDDFLVFSAMDALSVSCVSVFPRSQSLLWAPVPSAPPWWAPVPSSPPWLPALPTLPRSTATPLPRGPGPPSLPLFRLRSTALLDYIGASGSRSLGGGGAMSQILAMNFCSFTTRGHSSITLTFTPHSYISPKDYISHHPLHWRRTHNWLHWSHTADFHLHTLYKAWTFSLWSPSIV